MVTGAKGAGGPKKTVTPPAKNGASSAAAEQSHDPAQSTFKNVDGSRKQLLADITSKSDPRAARILARTLFRDMQDGGLLPEQILAVSTELIGMVAADLKEKLPETDQPLPKKIK